MDKPSLEVANSKGVVLRNGFIKRLRRKTQTHPKDQLRPPLLMPGCMHPASHVQAALALGAEAISGLVISSSGLMSTGLQSELRGGRQLHVIFQVLALYELSFRFLSFFWKTR